MPGVPASAINTGALAKGFQYELNQKLAADGLSAQVSVEATALSGRRRLRQAGTSQVKYTIVVMVPVGKDASKVGAGPRTQACAPRERCSRQGPILPAAAPGAHGCMRCSLLALPAVHACVVRGPNE
jgi:hypothetical protein